MEPKVIIYLIGGVLYFLYTISKKAQEKQAPPKTGGDSDTATKPIKPPVANPMEDILREIKRSYNEAEQRKKIKEPEPITSSKRLSSKPAKELFIHEKKKATFGQGAADAPVYQNSNDEKILKDYETGIKEGVTYKIPTAEEVAEEADFYRFDARQAFIGSVIFERKY